MKLNRSTTILLNLVLILVLALLLKLLISAPKSLRASPLENYNYKIVSEVDLESCIEEYWSQGYKLTSFSWDPNKDNWKIVFVYPPR